MPAPLGKKFSAFHGPTVSLSCSLGPASGTSLRPCRPVTFNMLVFYVEGLLVPYTTTKFEDHSLSSMHV
jgi:hypothetical protein